MLNIITNIHKEQMKLYQQYCSGKLTLAQYLELIKPLDIEIGKIEMATLQGIAAS